MRALERDNKKEADRRLREAREKYYLSHIVREKERANTETQALIEMVEGMLAVPARSRIIYIFSQLLACPTDGWVRKIDLVDKLDVTRKTVQNDIRPFWSLGLINRSNHGYQPTPKFFQLAEHLQQEEPGIYTILKTGLSNHPAPSR
jgi:predicted transcriptional regulator